MESTTVRKDELLAILQQNREQHREHFEKALEVYRERVLEWLSIKMDQARAGKRVTLLFHDPTPEDYTHMYDRAIRMLEMSVDDEIDISTRDFARFVMDDWDWSRTFTANTMSYLAEERDE